MVPVEYCWTGYHSSSSLCPRRTSPSQLQYAFLLEHFAQGFPMIKSAWTVMLGFGAVMAVLGVCAQVLGFTLEKPLGFSSLNSNT